MKDRTGFRALAMIMTALLLVLLAPASPAETISITATFGLPCEYAQGFRTSLVVFHNVAQYSVVVDAKKRPSALEVFENDLFRFVLLVDMNQNSVIATTYDKQSGNTFEVESRLDVLCAFPLKGTQFIPVARRPFLRVQKADLYLAENPEMDQGYRGIPASQLGFTAKTMPDFVDVIRQGIAIRCTAEVFPGGPLDDQLPDREPQDGLVPLDADNFTGSS